MWSLGVVAVELASGNGPNDILNTKEKVDALLATIPSGFSAEYRTAASLMLGLGKLRKSAKANRSRAAYISCAFRASMT